MMVHVCHCYFACKKTNGQTFTKFKLLYFSFDGLREVQMESLYMLFVVALFANKTAYKIASVQYYKLQ